MRLVRRIVLLIFWVLVLIGPASPVGAATGLQVEISGIEGPALENLQKALEPPASLAEKGADRPLWLRRFIRQVPQKAANALIPFGYYDPRIRTNLDESGEVRRLLVEVLPGAPVRVTRRHLAIEGYQHFALEAKLEEFPLAVGDVLRHDLYEAAKGELRALAIDLGYLDAGFSVHSILVDPEEETAEVDLVLTTGPRYRLGDVQFSGAPNYPDRFLRRYLSIHPGDVFSYPELGKTQQQLLDSDRFRSVTINARREDADEEATVPVDILLEPSARRRLRPGVGYGTDTGARLTLKYQDVNIRHLGHELIGDVLWAERQKNLIGNYLLPGYQNIDTLLAFRGGYQEENLETYETRYFFAEVEQLYGFGSGRVGSMFLRLQEESSEIADTVVSATMLMPGLRFRQARVDDPLRPGKGYRISLEARGTYRGVLSNITLGQMLGDAYVLFPLFWDCFLRLRGNVAYTWQPDEFEDIPASLRFFTGGDRTVRGYAYQSLGPEDSDGEVIGGKHLLVGSVEGEKRFLEDWGAALFFDAGNAFDSWTGFHLVKSAGIGLRYFTPVGPLRLDVARTIDEPRTHYRVHLNLGVGW